MRSILHRVIKRGKSKPQSRPNSIPEGDSERGRGIDPSDPTPSILSHQWQGLLNEDLPPTDSDATLESVLRSTAEMEKIKGLSKRDIPEGDLERGRDIDPSDPTPSMPYQWQDLLNEDLPPTDFDATLESVLRSTAEMEKIKGLSKRELQSVIDALSGYLETGGVMNALRKRCFKFLCKICATREVLPTRYMLEPSDLQPSGAPDYIGGFGRVWKGRAHGRTVAIKRLSVDRNHVEKIRERFCNEVMVWKMLSNPSALHFLGASMRGHELVMVSEWMENGNIKQYLQKNPHADKLFLLIDVARGITHLHNMNVVHGGLKGMDILIKNDGSACLADFGFASIVLDPETTDITTSSEGGTKGTYRWMSPELFFPKEFGLPSFKLTKKSDCYAFGMVIYEVLSGRVPFEEIKMQWQVPIEVRKGARPSIPDKIPPKMMEIWNIAQECWSGSPQDRPSSKAVLEKLEKLARLVTQYQWQDLLNPALHPTYFDTVLMSLLQSKAEVEKIQELDEQMFRNVVDVLDQRLGTRDLMNGHRKKYFKFLSQVCAARGILPTPCVLRPGDLEWSMISNNTGGFGVVWKGVFNGTNVAIKKLSVNATQLRKIRERFCCEVIMWKKLSNPNTLPLIGAYMRGSELVMVSDWMKNGNVRQYLQRNPHRNKLSLLTDVAHGVSYLHSMDIVHGDLKAVNILVKEDGSACLADFGLVSIVLDPETTDITTSIEGGGLRGTHRWMGPELFYPTDFGLSKFLLTKESDCYAFGMVIYEVLSGKIPFEEVKHPLQLVLAVVRGIRPSIPEDIPQKMRHVWSIAQDCWSGNPWDRPTFRTVLQKLNNLAYIKDDDPLPTPVSNQWKDLLDPDLPLENFDTLLMNLLDNATETGKMQGLNEQEAQNLIDVLGKYLGTGDVMDGLRKKCFVFLCSICAIRGVLPTPYTLKPSDIQHSESPGHTGSFGEVCKGRYNEKTVAVKRLLGSATQLEKLKERFCREVIMWRRLSSPNTLLLIGAYMHGPELVMVSEWMYNGNIRQYLQRKPLVNRLSLLADVAQGVVYLHSMNVVHGDLKGVNILVKDNGSACLADFGLMSIILDPGTVDVTASVEGGFKGTYRWMSPELFSPSDFDLPGFQLTKESDCYAFGMVIYEVLTGKTPFEDIKQTVQVALTVVRGIRPSVPEDIPPKMKEVWNIARDCWGQNPQERPSFQPVLDKLNDFARVEDTTPFAVYQPMPMLANGEHVLRSRTLSRLWNSLDITEREGLEIEDSSNRPTRK